jgi:hypothetical protein
MSGGDYDGADYRIGGILHDSGFGKKIDSALAYHAGKPHAPISVKSGEIFSRAMLTDL